MAEEVGRGGSKGKVMIAIDESECSHYALEWALDNLKESITSTSPLIIFTVQSNTDLSYIYAASLGSAPPELIRSVQEHEKNLKSALLKKAKDICASRGVVLVETITEVGDPKEAVCDAVEKYNITLLVLGNHGKGAIQRAFLGSVSNYCVHNAKCPVLVVKKPQ